MTRFPVGRKGGGASHQRGNAFPRPPGRLYGFRRQRRYKKWRRRRRTSPAGTVSQPIGKPFNGQAKGLLWLTWRSYAGPPQYIYLPRAGARSPPVRRSRSQAEPLAPRAKGPAAPSTLARESGRQPSGILESTARSRPRRRRLNPHVRQGLSLKPVNPSASGPLSSSFSSTTGTPALTRASASTPWPLIFFPLKVPS